MKKPLHVAKKHPQDRLKWEVFADERLNRFDVFRHGGQGRVYMTSRAELKDAIETADILAKE